MWTSCPGHTHHAFYLDPARGPFKLGYASEADLLPEDKCDFCGMTYKDAKLPDTHVSDDDGELENLDGDDLNV